MIADLVRFGAPADILVDARPHVGSNRLPQVLTALREHLERAGRRVPLRRAVAGLRARGGRVRAVAHRGRRRDRRRRVVLAVGHSARPVYDWAAAEGVALERKAFALGVRIEHPQPLIDGSSTAPRPATPSCRPRSTS